jgi:peptidyl-prolyl cis-trans isomerase C
MTLFARWLPRVVLGALLLAPAGCNEQAVEPRGDAGTTPAGLTPEQAAAILAKVGDKTITLGDFAATLERMNEYDRLRYQTKEQRRKLLEEMIDSELLAQEAERRGLDKQPEVQLELQQVLRDAMLAKARESLPTLDAIPDSEVREYYDQHRDRFEEPERRRVSAIVLATKADAEKVLAAVEKAKGSTEWGELFYKHSTTAPKKRDPLEPADLAGDLGIVGPVGDARGSSPQVPEAVQRAVFTIAEVGKTLPNIVEADGKFYVVRLAGRTAGRGRSYNEAQRSIRILLYQDKLKAREAEVVSELRKRFAVQTDEKALAGVQVPSLVDPHAPGWPGAPSPTDGPGPDGQPGAQSPVAPGAPVAPTGRPHAPR